MSLRARAYTPAELGNALREFRLEAKLTQRQLAAELGVSQRWIFELEQGKPGIFTDRLFRVLRALSVRMFLEQADLDGQAQ